MLHDALRVMSDDELVANLQKLAGPMMGELMRRGYRVRLDERNSASGVPIFVRYPTPRAVAE